jgi:hypothetical protein
MYSIHKLNEPVSIFNGTMDDLALAQERGYLKGEVFAAREYATGTLSYHAPCYGTPVQADHPGDLPRMEVETMAAIIAQHGL